MIIIIEAQQLCFMGQHHHGHINVALWSLLSQIPNHLPDVVILADAG